jgi:hypothetical protein
MLVVAGVTAMAVTVAVEGVIVRFAAPLTPLSDAVMVALPAATPVASPAELMVAVFELELVQVTVDVTLAVELSL